MVDSPYERGQRSAQKFVQDASLIGRGWPLGPLGCFLEERHQNTRRNRVAAPADLVPTRKVGVRLGLGFGLGSGWSGQTCKVEIDHTRLAQSVLRTSPAHRGPPNCSGINPLGYW